MESQHKSKSGLQRIWRALFYSRDGFVAAVKHEHAFRQELMLLITLLPTALLLPVNTTDRVLLIGSLLIVLIVELLNSAIEAVVDRISLDEHALAKRAKDLGSAAVFLGITCVVLVWVAIAGPVLWKYVH